MISRSAQVAEKARRLRFERTVRRALSSLPPDIRARLQNVEVVVEDEPHDDSSDELYGLYEGTPLTERGSSYSMVLPDKITLFRGPLERTFPRQDELEAEIQITLFHELAHHLGFDEPAMDRLGLS